MAWTTACPDWANRLRAGESIIPPPIFPEQAEEALRVFRTLRIVDAPGSPTFGEACAPWVFDLVGSIFGAYDARPDSETTGRRLITEWFVCLPKKNSKSTLAAGIMMTALILNWRESAEFAILAPTIEIANNSYAPARDMCSERHDEELSGLMHVQSHEKKITHRVNSGMLKVIAADENTVGGKKSVGTLIDELWLLGKQPKAESMLREATGGLASRPEGFVLYLTTQSDDPPAGIFRQKLQYARDVRDGKIIDPRFVPVIYEFPPEMIAAGEHRNPKNFGMVNPNLGYSVDREFLEREMTKAESAGEESVRGFLAKHLNVEIGLALRSDRWVGADYWQAQTQEGLTLEYLLEHCDVIEVGIDFGGMDDLLGFAVLGRHRKSKRWLSWGHAWAQETALERRKSEASRFRDFEKDGDLTITANPGDDVREVADMVERCYGSGLLHKIGVDPARIGALLSELSSRGIPDDMVVGISQGWRLAGAIITTERRLAEGRMKHGGSAMMAWCVSNARIEPRANSVLITKAASGTAKIDPLMALFNAVELLSLNPDSNVIDSDYELMVA